MDDRPFTLQPRPAPPRGPQNIAEFIRRVNAEPGGFRALNTEALRAQAAREREQEGRGNGPSSEHDVDMDSASSDAGASDDENDAVDTKDIATARGELLNAIHQTHQTSMFALDFISLLLSKENPAQAVTTFSPGLRDMVGIGTLGATMLEAPTALTHGRVPQNKMVAIGKRLMDLNKAADTALAASKRLQREIGFETRYWSEVLGVSEAGWQTFRMPVEPPTMGVKFGFSNAAHGFKANNTAPLRRAADGSVKLEHGRMGGGSKRLRVSILEDGVVVGRSSLARPLPADATIQDRVKESRDTIFAQELWQEVNREARTLTHRGVQLQDSAVTFPLHGTRTVSLRLATPGEAETSAAEAPSTAQDALANWLCTNFSLLLSNAHRVIEQRRSQPVADKDSAPPYSLLRPLMTFHEYDRTIQQCVRHLSEFAAVLRSAGLATTVAMKEPPLTANPSAAASTALATALLSPPPVQFDLTITPTARLRILLRSFPQSFPGATSFTVFLLPPSPSPTQPQILSNPLAKISPSGTEEFPRIESLFSYLHGVVPIALAATYYKLAPPQQTTENPPAAGAPDDQPRWTIHASLRGIVDVDTGEYGVHFKFAPDPATGQLQLKVTGNFMEDVEAGGDAEGRGEKKKVRREWTWPRGTETETEMEPSLEQVVRQVLANGATDWD